MDHKLAQPLQGNPARFENEEVGVRLRPAPICYHRPEHDRPEAPLDVFNRAVGGPVSSDENDRSVYLDTVETDRDAIVHRESNCRAIGHELRVDDTRKGFRESNVAPFEVQDDLRGGNVPDKRRKVDAQASDRTSKLIDIAEAKYLGFEAWFVGLVAHSSICPAALRYQNLLIGDFPVGDGSTSILPNFDINSVSWAR
ncbi:MAG TPA: hypothetical protein VKR55_01460 [Bradyrhizobium sp.]|uniref:hypothetical protein n=1 Tax=Bradyrhizobium sp. TaxID=376 RepID=UPI002CE44CF7|nr:hypothetical protein [Bradyrhizobium sp.]HLZ00798.1 hypothetical protein [Bradyrhizobium sp.]